MYHCQYRYFSDFRQFRNLALEENMAEVILFGEPMAMFVAQSEGDLADVENFVKLLAGAEVNVAIGLKRLGHSVSYITKLGKDPFGRYIEKKLRKEGIDPEISYDAEHWTGFQMKSRVSEGDPEVVYFRKNSAASHITAEDIEKVNLDGAKVLHVTGIPPALSADCRKATYRLIERARENGLMVSFDPNLRPSLWENEETMIQVVNDLASRADLVLPGTGEGKTLMRSSDPAAIADFYLKNGAKTVIVKDGPRGAYVAEGDRNFIRPGYPVAEVVDTVGAGDGFAVGVLSGYLEGLSLEKMADRGNAIGAIQVSVQSDNEGLPTREELKKFQEVNRR